MGQTTQSQTTLTLPRKKHTITDLTTRNTAKSHTTLSNTDHTITGNMTGDRPHSDHTLHYRTPHYQTQITGHMTEDHTT